MDELHEGPAEGRLLKLVVRAPNWLGDAVLSLAALRDVRRAYPGARLTVLARPAVAPLYEAVREADAVLVATGFRDETRLLRAGGFNRAIVFPNSIGTALAAALAGVPERWGYATQGRGPLLTRASRIPASVRGRTQVDYYRTMLAGLGIDVAPPADSSLACPEGWRADGAELLVAAGSAGFIGIAAGAAKGSAKQWPPERFAVAARSVARKTGSGIVILGSNADREAGAAVAKALGPEAPLDLCGRTTLPRFVGVIANLRGLMANDSGAMHLGAAIGVPTVGVFGPTNPLETGPSGPRATLVRGAAACSPCAYATCPIDHRCMTSVAPDAVASALEGVMAS